MSTKFYNFRQNNSGGSFTLDEKVGISVDTIIEATSAADADGRAERIGIYFDGCDSGQDCNCCGDRWYSSAFETGDDVPMVYGKEVKPGDLFPAKDDPGRDFGMKWMDGKPDGYIHYLDGRVESFWTEQAERKDLAGDFGYGVAFNKYNADVFVCGHNGYDETGNKKAADGPVKKDKPFGPWNKPEKATIKFNKGYGNAWFPTKEAAEEYAQSINDLNALVRGHLQAFADGAESKTAKQVIKMWLV